MPEGTRTQSMPEAINQPSLIPTLLHQKHNNPLLHSDHRASKNLGFSKPEFESNSLFFEFTRSTRIMSQM